MSATFPSQMVRRAVACALGRRALESEITLRPAAAHQSNLLYDAYVDGEHLIAKEYLRGDIRDAAQHEYEALRYLESLQLAPQPVFFDPSVGPVVLYRYMEGEMWDRRVPSASELGDLANVWLRFHGLHPDGVWMCSGQTRRWPDVFAGLRTAIEAYARAGLSAALRIIESRPSPTVHAPWSTQSVLDSQQVRRTTTLTRAASRSVVD